MQKVQVIQPIDMFSMSQNYCLASSRRYQKVAEARADKTLSLADEIAALQASAAASKALVEPE